MRTPLLVLVMIGLAGTAAARENVEVLARTCNSCHGVGGVSAGTTMPSIGGLPENYLKRIMKQWKYDERSAITMNRIVKGLSNDEIDALAAYFAAQPWVPIPQPAVAETLAKGKSTAFELCQDCHGATGGDPDIDAPKLNGQWSRYMELELEKYRNKEFRMPHHKMKKAVRETKPVDAAAAARFFGTQGK